MSYRPPPLACALMMMMMASPSLCPDRAPLVHHLPSSPSVMGGIHSSWMSHTTEQNREIERERENNTQICYHQHIGSFLFSYQLRDKSLVLGDQQRDGGKALKDY